MEIDFYIQSQAFLYSLLFGVGLGMLYGVFKFIRVAFLSTKTAVIIADIIFMLIATRYGPNFRTSVVSHPKTFGHKPSAPYNSSITIPPLAATALMSMERLNDRG